MVGTVGFALLLLTVLNTLSGSKNQTDDNRIKVSEINARTQNLQSAEEFLVDMQKIALADIKRRPKSPLIERMLAISKAVMTMATSLMALMVGTVGFALLLLTVLNTLSGSKNQKKIV